MEVSETSKAKQNECLPTKITHLKKKKTALKQELILLDKSRRFRPRELRGHHFSRNIEGFDKSQNTRAITTRAFSLRACFSRLHPNKEVEIKRRNAVCDSQTLWRSKLGRQWPQCCHRLKTASLGCSFTLLPFLRRALHRVRNVWELFGKDSRR